MIWIALFVVILALGAYIGVCISDNSMRESRATIAALVLSQQFCDELERETAEWRP